MNRSASVPAGALGRDGVPFRQQQQGGEEHGNGEAEEYPIPAPLLLEETRDTATHDLANQPQPLISPDAVDAPRFVPKSTAAVPLTSESGA